MEVKEKMYVMSAVARARKSGGCGGTSGTEIFGSLHVFLSH